LPLDVFSLKNNFVADFFRLKLNFIEKNEKFAFLANLWGT